MWGIMTLKTNYNTVWLHQLLHEQTQNVQVFHLKCQYLPGVFDSLGIKQRTKWGWVLLKLVISLPRFSCLRIIIRASASVAYKSYNTTKHSLNMMQKLCFQTSSYVISNRTHFMWTLVISSICGFYVYQQRTLKTRKL